MGVAQAGHDRLAGVLVAAHAQGGVLLGDAGEGATHLVQVGLALGVDGTAERWLRERDPRQRDGFLAGGQCIARAGLGQLGHRADVASHHLAHLLLTLASNQVQRPDALGAALVGVPGLRIGLEGAGVDAEVGEATNVGVGRSFEHQGDQTALGVGLE